MEEDNSNKTSVLKNTTVIVAIIGLIGTIVGVAPEIIKIIKPPSQPAPATKTTTTADSSSKTAPPAKTVPSETVKKTPTECWSFKAEIPEILPLSLKNSIESVDDLYWFRLEAANNCNRTLHLNVTFETELYLHKGKAGTSEFSLRPGESVKKKVSPKQFKVLQSDVKWPVPINVKWKVFDDTKKKLGSDTEKITVLDKNIIKWDLNMPHKPVSKKYLLASLAAWTMNPHPNLKEMSKEIKKGVSKRTGFAKNWFAHCYLKFFQASTSHNPLVNIISISAFPLVGEQQVRLPLDILSDIQEEGGGGSYVNPLEACLFLAALTKVHDRKEFRNVRLVLFFLEHKDAVQKTEFLLSWFDFKKWNAISMNHVDKPFDENKQNASRLLNEMLDKKPQIVQDLDSSGVFYKGKDTDLIALDFNKAASYFYIRGLP
jgi:hypothetical protein